MLYVIVCRQYCNMFINFTLFSLFRVFFSALFYRRPTVRPLFFILQRIINEVCIVVVVIGVVALVAQLPKNSCLTTATNNNDNG